MSDARYALLAFLEQAPWSRPIEIAASLGWPDRRASKHLSKARVAGLVTRDSGAVYALSAAGQQRLEYVRANNLVVEGYTW